MTIAFVFVISQFSSDHWDFKQQGFSFSFKPMPQGLQYVGPTVYLDLKVLLYNKPNMHFSTKSVMFLFKFFTMNYLKI